MNNEDINYEDMNTPENWGFKAKTVEGCGHVQVKSGKDHKMADVPASLGHLDALGKSRPSHEQAMAGYTVACSYGVLEARAFMLVDKMFRAFEENK